jgi:formamidopyrimidine-DNA glycosylase
MPELPEVETVCRGLAKALTGAKILHADVRRPDLRFPLPKNLAAQLKSRNIESVTRRAKYIVMALDNQQSLLLHLGMSGRMVITHHATPPEKHDHLIFTFDNGAIVRFNDPRRFGMCDLVVTDTLDDHKLLRHLGVEPLKNQFTPAYLTEKFYNKKTSVKEALLDQRVVVGVGNIYASEALFHAGINPQRRAGACTVDQVARLVPAITRVLKKAIAAGGSSLRDYVQADGELGNFQKRFAVYDREELPCSGCTCDITKTGGVQRITQGGRSSFYCATKQK